MIRPVILLLEYGTILVERYISSTTLKFTIRNLVFLSLKTFCWTTFSQKKPSQRISIRAIETERYRVVEKRSNDVLEEIEESKAFFQVYEGAIYMNQGRTYLVEALDTKEKIALCKLVNVDYYTRPRDHTCIHVTGGETVSIFWHNLIVVLLCDSFFQFITVFIVSQAYAFKAPKNQLNKTTAQAQPCSVKTDWFGFYRIRKKTNEVYDDAGLSLPSYSYQSQVSLTHTYIKRGSQSVWFRLSRIGYIHSIILNIFFRCNRLFGFKCLGQ